MAYANPEWQKDAQTKLVELHVNGGACHPAVAAQSEPEQD